MAKSGAQAALRGYRLQASYTLLRLLQVANEESIQLEGREDLDIIGPDGQSTEFIQVKAFDEPLTLSLLEPSKPRSLFRRILTRRKLHSRGTERLVSFSPFGVNLAAAWKADGDERRELRRALSEFGYSSKDVDTILASLVLEAVTSDQVETTVKERLRQTVVGADPLNAFNLLHAWLFVASERSDRVMSADLRDRLLAVGRFVAERAAYHEEWFTFINPIVPGAIGMDLGALHAEFYSGVSARSDHVAAGLDVRRMAPLSAIDGGFALGRAVVIHGASGQGKTTLAYRYLHDYVPAGWSFAVKSSESRTHALRIASALLGHLNAIGAPAYVYVDVEPGDSTWLDLVRALLEHPLVSVLVTIREEDWRRGASPSEFAAISDLELQFEESEARAIYDQLIATSRPSHVLDFEDAWTRFGGSGPLLEFVHFVARNETLLSRLSGQVRRLQDDVRLGRLGANELDLLRLVAVATAHCARIELLEIVRTLAIAEPSRTVALFEKEFLLRLDSTRRQVEALHPIRSEMLARLLTDETFEPLGPTAARCLPLIVESDLEEYLRRVMSRTPELATTLRKQVDSFAPRTWTGVGGTVRALLWLAAKSYLSSNDAVIRDLEARFRSSWPFMFMVDLANVDALAPGLMKPLYERLDGVKQALLDEMAEFRRRLTPADLDDVARWLRSFPVPVVPQDHSDWISHAEVLFWLHHLGIGLAPKQSLPAHLVNEACSMLPLPTAVDLLYVLSLPGFGTAAALSGARSQLLARFQLETLTSHMEDDGAVVRAHFIVDVEKLQIAAAKDGWSGALNSEAMRRVGMLRRLFPSHSGFGCQGYGHRSELVPTEVDDSRKTSIPRSSLPPLWPLKVNQCFWRLGEYQFRVSNWNEYSKCVTEQRRAAVEALEAFSAAVEPYFANRRRDSGALVVRGWEEASRLIDDLVAFPRDAVDEWGQTSESTTDKDAENGRASREFAPALHRHRAYRDAYRKYLNSLSNFFKQATDAFIVVPALRVTSASDKPALLERVASANLSNDRGRLAGWNLFEAKAAVTRFQEEFRSRFRQFDDQNELARLEARERTALRRSLATWLQFSRHPKKVIQRAAVVTSERLLDDRVSRLRRDLRKRLDSVRSESLSVSMTPKDHLWEGRGALWLLCDVADPMTLGDAFEKVYSALVDVLATASDNEFDKYAAIDTWAVIHVIPLLRGRPIDPSGWRFETMSIVSETAGSKPAPWRGVPQSLPSDAMALLAVGAPNWPTLELVDGVYGAAGSLAFTVSSIKNVLELPDPTGVGDRVMEAYVASTSQELSRSYRKLDDAMTALANFLSAMIDEERASLPTPLRTVAEALPELNRMLSPDGSGKSARISASMEDIAAWHDRLVKALPLLYAARLFWLQHLSTVSPA